jgi:hypothetical protein
MGGVYLGLLSERDYLFVTNDKFGSTEREGAIIRVNNFCGALIVTAKGRFLIRLREVLDRSLSNINRSEEGISIDLAQAIVESLEQEFQREPHFKRNPLPFLLLLVGCSSKESSSFEHIFIRNRVVDIIDKYGQKEYITRSEIQPPVPATNLFYGHSELPEYLLRQIAPNNLGPEAMRVFAYLALSETQKIDDSLFPGILMATVSRENGFEWIKEEELYRLSGLAKTVDRMLMGKLSGFFTPLESPAIYGGDDKNK